MLARRLGALLPFGGLMVLWSRGPEPITAAAGVVSAVACACAIVWPAERLSGIARQVLATLGLVGVVSCSVAQLFPRPGSVAALWSGLVLASALLAACAALGGRVARAVFVVASLVIAALHTLLLPRLGTDGHLEASAARAVAQASLSEAAGIVRHGLRRESLTAVLWALWLVVAQAAFAPGIHPARSIGKRSAAAGRRARLALLIVAALAGGWASFRLATASRPGRFALDVVRAVRERRADLFAVHRLRETRRSTVGRVERLGPLLDGARTIVVVIGEASARSHWSLYGYPRPTNDPLLPWARDLVLYTDVVSPDSRSVPVLERVLAGVGSGSGSGPRTRPPADIVSVARAAGYQVSWLSALDGTGASRDYDRVMAEAAQQRVFVDSPDAVQAGSRSRDESLIPALERVLEHRQPRHIAFVHLSGGHAPRCSTFDPEDAAIRRLTWREAGALFGRHGTDVASVDCYDKSLAHESAVLADLLALARRQGVDTLLYFSDHGESPVSSPGQDGNPHAAERVEIPLFWWLDQRFWSRHAAAAAALQANRNGPVLSSDLFQTLQDLLGAGTGGPSPGHSLLRDGYVSSPRALFGGLLDYDRWSPAGDDAERARANMRELARRNPGLYAGVWAHRVDTLGKLQQAMGLFAGVELDVTWKDGTLFVYHPPAENLGIELRDYLRVAARRPDLGFWFDLKLPPAGAFDAAVRDALDDLDRNGTLRRRCVAELPPGHDHAALAGDLAARGWRVSFQLPEGTDSAPGRTSAPPDMAEALRRERDFVAAAGYSLMSYAVGDRDTATVLLQDPRLRALERITWDLSLDSSAEDFLARVEGFHESIVLVNLPSRYEN